jgi:prepilin-type N-terminal cleavage/methylation domain-containing protein
LTENNRTAFAFLYVCGVFLYTLSIQLLITFMNIKHRRGFTIVEFLVVLAIIGLLATLALLALSSARTKTRDNARLLQVREVQTALELFTLDSGGVYPISETPVALGAGTGASLCSDSATGFQGVPCAEKTFMATVPRDELVSGSAQPCGPTSIDICDAAYSGDEEGNDYRILFWLEGGSGSYPGGLNCATKGQITAGSQCQ